ncbi:hypothetical protein IGI39_001711 [Enterococcus sp. AZ135]|uniref:GPP34 family phosphoprotein n=1 Tax=unclassified Enterococcus TaxID=2608891 RepID=UPI003F1F3120
MNNLSLSQQYLLFTMNRQGKISSVNYYVGMCLVMAGLLDLQKTGVIELDKKEIIVHSQDLPTDIQYLDCLLEKVISLKRKRIEKIATAYGATFFEKDLKQLVSQIRSSLIDADEVAVKNDSTSLAYIAKEVTISKIVARLENLNQMDHDGLSLAILLKKSSILKKYIDKDVRKVLDMKIKKVKKDPVSQQTQTMLSQLDWLVGSLVVVTSV